MTARVKRFAKRLIKTVRHNNKMAPQERRHWDLLRRRHQPSPYPGAEPQT